MIDVDTYNELIQICTRLRAEGQEFTASRNEATGGWRIVLA